MMMLKALSTGFKRTVGTPWLLLLSWAILMIVAAPAGFLIQRAIERDIGASGVHADLRERLDTVWLSEFHSRSGALEASLATPTVSRVDFLRNLDLLFNGNLFRQQRGLVATGVVFAMVWLLLLGGAIDRFARGPGRFVLAQFLGSAGRYYLRLLKITAVSLIPFWALYRGAGWLYGSIAKRTIDVTSETTLLLYYLVAAVPLILLATVVMLVFDFAKVAAVLDEEPRLWPALARGARFVGRRPFPTLGLMAVVGLGGVLLILLRTWTDLGTGEATVTGVLLVFGLGQLFVMVRLGLRLLLVASQTALYRAGR